MKNLEFSKDSVQILLRNVLKRAFQTEVLFFTPPYDDFKKIDHGIRDILWPHFLHTNDVFTPSPEDPEKRFFLVRSNLGFYNIIIYMNLNKSPDFISIGPFRCDEISPDYFKKLLQGQHLNNDTLQMLLFFYETLPFVSLPSLLDTTKEILAFFYPEFAPCVPIVVEFNQEVHEIKVNSQMMQEFSAEIAENYQKALFHFTDTLVKGNADLSHQTLIEFLQTSKIFSSRNFAECQNNMHLLNAYCHMALLRTNVHPAHVLKLYTTMQKKINILSNRNSLLNLANDLCHKYTLLVKNYSFSEYSKTIRSVINYINLHLDENLTLATLAEKFQKNPSLLSSSFTKEVGCNITSYVHQARINEALRYFNTSKMSVSEVSLTVGFQDFAYFSKLFKKQIGCSPREYCKKINRTAN